MSVSASGGTGQETTCVSYFGGLGQFYRVKVWAVSGLNTGIYIYNLKQVVTFT